MTTKQLKYQLNRLIAYSKALGAVNEMRGMYVGNAEAFDSWKEARRDLARTVKRIKQTILCKH